MNHAGGSKAGAVNGKASSSGSSSTGVASQEEQIPAEAGKGQAEVLMYASKICFYLSMYVDFSSMFVVLTPEHEESDKPIRGLTGIGNVLIQVSPLRILCTAHTSPRMQIERSCPHCYC